MAVTRSAGAGCAEQRRDVQRRRDLYTQDIRHTAFLTPETVPGAASNRPDAYGIQHRYHGILSTLHFGVRGIKPSPTIGRQTGMDVPPQRVRRTRIRLLALAAGIVAVMTLAFTYVELRAGRDDLLQSVRLEAETLIDAINRGGERAFVSSRALDHQLRARLRSVADLTAHLEEHGPLDPDRLLRLVRSEDLGCLLVIDQRGRLQSAHDPGWIGIRVRTELRDALTDGSLVQSRKGTPDLDDPERPGGSGRERGTPSPESNGHSAEIPALVIEPVDDAEACFLVAVSRRTAPGAVVAGVRAQDLLDMRRSVGIGTLIRDIGDNPDIVFVSLQDMDGIIAGSSGVSDLSTIEDDAFLRSAFKNGRTQSRIVDREDAPPMLEVVGAFDLGDGNRVLSRVGLTLENVRRIQQRGLLRLGVLATALAGSIIIGLFLLTTRDRFTALRRTHDMVRSTTDRVLETMTDAVLVCDSDGVIRVGNHAAAALLGTTTDALRGAPYGNVCPDDMLMLARVLSEGRDFPLEERTLHARSDGSPRTVQVSATRLVDGGDGSVLAIAVARDITDERRLRAALEQRDRLTAMGELAGSVAHEIRNPLNAIHMIVQRFGREFSPTVEQEEYHRLVALMRGEVHRVNDIVTQFLRFARPPAPRLREEDLVPVVRRATDLVREELSARIRLSCVTPDTLRCTFDAQRIEQAVINLLHNAVQALPGYGDVRVSVRIAGEMAVIEVADSGSGIPDEIRSRMFNLYFTTKAAGTGIGLSLVHQIASEHGGEIRAENGSSGGAVFTLLLHLSPQESHSHDTTTRA